MNRFDRYLKLVRWAGNRYRQANGYLITSVGGVPSVYSHIELAAARKYLKLPVGWEIPGVPA